MKVEPRGLLDVSNKYALKGGEQCDCGHRRDEHDCWIGPCLMARPSCGCDRFTEPMR